MTLGNYLLSAYNVNDNGLLVCVLQGQGQVYEGPSKNSTDLQKGAVSPFYCRASLVWNTYRFQF